MSERERWTVYPLLFLALGIALKDKLFNEISVKDVRCKTMVCSALVVDDPKGHPQVNLLPSGTMHCKNVVSTDTVHCKNAASTDTMQCKNLVATSAVQTQNVVCKLLLVPDANGQKQVAVSTNEAGGLVQIVGNANGLTTVLGNTDRLAGLMFVDQQGTVHRGQLFSSPVAPKKLTPEAPADDAASPEATDQEETPPANEDAPPGSAEPPAEAQQDEPLP